MEIINKPQKHSIKAVIFDFDGTISTLRAGWEEVMEPLMLEMITDGGTADGALKAEVRDYINESTGIQTALQMEWLARRVKAYGAAEKPLGLWQYKDEYNRRLMERVDGRLDALRKGAAPENYMIKGSRELLDALKEQGAALYVASGTDDGDVINEVSALGLSKYFVKVSGSPYRRKDCTKEGVIRSLLAGEGFKGENLAVVGDGKVEIRLGKEAGAITLGVAADEKNRGGIDSAKRERLIGAGADAVIGDFLELDMILQFLGM